MCADVVAAGDTCTGSADAARNMADPQRPVCANVHITPAEAAANWQEQMYELDALAAVHPAALRLLAIHHPAVPDSAAAAVCRGDMGASELANMVTDEAAHSAAEGPASASTDAVPGVDLELVMAPEVLDAREVAVFVNLVPDAAADNVFASCSRLARPGGTSRPGAGSAACMARVAHVPPLQLSVRLPRGYPSHAAPRFELHVAWLSAAQLRLVAERLVAAQQAAGLQAPVLLSWAECLREEAAEVLSLADGVVLSEASGSTVLRGSWSSTLERYELVRHRLVAWLMSWCRQCAGLGLLQAIRCTSVTPHQTA
jgi:RWD domain